MTIGELYWIKDSYPDSGKAVIVLDVGRHENCVYVEVLNGSDMPLRGDIRIEQLSKRKPDDS